MSNYDIHTLRLNSLYDNRTRRANERFKLALESIDTAVGAIDTRVVTLEGSSGGGTAPDQVNFSVDGTTSESISAPSADGEVLIRFCNKVVSPGTHTLNFTSSSAIDLSGFAVLSSGSTWAGGVLYARSVYYNDNYVWLIFHDTL